MQTRITFEESLQLASQKGYWDGFSAGAKSAADHAKALLVQNLIASKEQANGTIAQQEHAAAGHAPDRADQLVSQAQSAGAGSEPERAGVTDSKARRHGLPCDGDDAADVIRSDQFPIDGDADVERAFAGDAAEPLPASD